MPSVSVVPEHNGEVAVAVDAAVDMVLSTIVVVAHVVELQSPTAAT